VIKTDLFNIKYFVCILVFAAQRVERRQLHIQEAVIKVTKKQLFLK